MIKRYMSQALELAKNAGEQGQEVPVAALIVKDGEVLSMSVNACERKEDVCEHAEIIALKAASDILNSRRLIGCEMYVTLEPCPMCAWAIIQARVSRVYFAAHDFLYGALGSKLDLREVAHSNLEVIGGILEDESKALLKSYFQDLRA